jgi:hypothetical protein
MRHSRFKWKLEQIDDCQGDDIQNLCRRVQEATVLKENLTKRRGSDLDKEEVDSMITTIG